MKVSWTRLYWEHAQQGGDRPQTYFQEWERLGLLQRQWQVGLTE